MIEKIKTWFNRTILPYIILFGFVFFIALLFAAGFYLDRVRFFY